MTQATTSQTAQPSAPAPPASPRATLEREIEKAVEQALEGVRVSVPQTEKGALARARIDEALARLRANREARIAGARPVIEQPPFDPSVMIPPQAVEMAYGFFAMCAVIIIGWPLARAFARRMDRRGAAPAPELNQRLDRMEQAIEAVAIEVERISEGQRFVTRLMAEERGLAAGSPGERWPERQKEPEPVGRAASDRGRL